MKNKTIAIIIIILFVLTKILEVLGFSTNSPLSLLSLLQIATLVFIIISAVRLWKEEKLVFVTFFLATIIGFVFDVLLMIGRVVDGDSSLIINSIATVAYIISFIMIIVKLFNKQGTQSLDTSKKKLIFKNKKLSDGAIIGISIGVIMLGIVLHFLLDTCPIDSPLSSLCLKVDL